MDQFEHVQRLNDAIEKRGWSTAEVHVHTVNGAETAVIVIDGVRYVSNFDNAFSAINGAEDLFDLRCRLEA